MHKTFLVSVIALVTAVGLSPGASASSATGTYTLATTPFVSIVCSPDCLGTEDAVPGTGLNYGGYAFAATGKTPTTVTIADASGGAVAFTVCQDPNGDFLCGDTGEPQVEGCGTSVDLSLSAVAFRADLETSVFVRAVDPLACPDAFATSGTITLTYAP